MSLDFVNIHGRPVGLRTLKKSAARKSSDAPMKRVYDTEHAKQHMGFEVVGYSQESVDAAQADLAKKRAEKKLPEVAFDPEAWMNKTKPKRAIKRVFFVPEAADLAAQMLIKQGGWHRVQALKILKG
jgi:hypothetical protein